MTEILFRTRWGVPEAIDDEGCLEVGGYNGFWHAKWYRCDRSDLTDGGCSFERTYVVVPGEGEVCRYHLSPTEQGFEAYAETAEARFLEARERVCAETGHHQWDWRGGKCVCQQTELGFVGA